MDKKQIYINGEWFGKDLNTIDVYNPANGELIGKVPNAGVLETRNAIEAAHAAFTKWSKKTANERSVYLKKLHALIEKNKEELATIITKEMGKPLHEARGEVEYANSFVEWFAEQSKRVYGETIPASDPNKRLLVLKNPIGVVGAITPWNFPAAMITRKMAPALAAGCTIVIKPSELTPFTAIRIMELCEEAGIPNGVVNLVTGDPHGIGKELLENEKVKKITFTGSTRVGKLLMEQAASQVKKVSLELGGHAPIIILEDADLNKAIKGVMGAKFRNAGQACIAGNRVYVQPKIYNDFIQKLTQEVEKLKVGNGLENHTDIGPLINKQAYEKVMNHVQDSCEKGATVVTGGSGEIQNNAYYFLPTVLTNVDNSMKIMNEETFGPVIPIQKVESIDEMVKLANNSSYGLAAYVFSESLSKGLNIVENLEYGIIGWNDGLPSTAQAPFGGMKESGLGREGAKEGIEEFLEIKYVSVGL
ncbi:NAD-dependent succinate-semialdehyde dehydrogenase [Bacillus salipaludis]|uniref:Aldehyde dehydrogenase n=1 Tax=Bacillus salipaludis TaxID=2547811 RepID=A0A4R5VT61_9BACI|nr:NAD-dependent succinate-semialdehyde dehydrogenase [Bacillus salipaludis]